MVNNVDNAILYNSIKEIYKQAIKIFPKELGYLTLETFYSDVLVGINSFGKNIKLRVIQIEEGRNKGKLTLEQKTEYPWRWEEVNDINPVDCYNLIKPGESLAEAVSRLY